MIMIRMQRTGRKHDPVFRVIVAEHTTGPKSGKIVEKLGWYDAKQGKKELDGERIKYWISNGAQVSGTVNNFLVEEKIIEGSKVNVLPKRRPKAEEPSAEKPEGGSEEAKAEASAEEGETVDAPTEEKKEETPAEEPKEEEKKGEPQEDTKKE